MKALLLLLGKVKLLKVALTGGTMFLSVFTYSFFFGWQYAVGLVLLIFVHETGHYIAARRRGLDVGTPTFIPFVGAWIELKKMPHNAEVEAYVGFAGPLVGSLGALICYFVAREYHSQLLLALAYAGFMINLFNLIPVSPLDGGRITAVLTPRVWLLGIPLMVALFLYRPSPMLVLIAILAAPQFMKAFSYDADDPENSAYYGVSTETRMTYGLSYLGLALFLADMTYQMHDMLSFAR